MSDTTRGYYIRVTDGTHWAIEMRPRPSTREPLPGQKVTPFMIPALAVGPLEPKQVMLDVDALDWSTAITAERFNVAKLVAMTERERLRVSEGRPRKTRRKEAPALQPEAGAVTGEAIQVSDGVDAASVDVLGG